MTRFGIQSAGRSARRDESDVVLTRTHGNRHRIICLAVTTVAVLYGVRLGQLQIVEGAEHRERRLAQSATTETLQAPRGRIVDREGRVLAVHDTRYQAFMAVDELVIDRDDAIDAVASVVDVPRDRRDAVLEADGGWPLIAANVSDDERVQLERLVGRGLHFEGHPARDYPRGSVGRRLIGTVGSDGQGRTGLELQLDALLTGAPGQVEMWRDALGNAYRAPEGLLVEPEAGQDIFLTIDAELQRITENELERALVETGASGGDIVLLDPRNGDLLAVASKRADAASDRVPAFSDAYEPGSTIKPFLLASLLEEDVVDLDEIIDVEGGQLQMGRRRITDVHGYDELSVREVISKSSNVGAAKLSERITPAVQHRYLRDFGFGMRTQLDHSAESPGVLRRPDAWTALSPASHAIGYELSVTSLQLVAAYGALANGGVLVEPRLVKEIRSANGRVISSPAPRKVRRVVTEEVAATLRDVLEEVVADGTATLAQMASLSVAGKTGTARLAADGGYAAGRYRASFVGFAPADDPRIVILTRLEDPTSGSYYGGAIAAPTSQATLAAALAADGTEIDPRLVVSGAQPRPWSGRRSAQRADEPFVFAVDGAPEPWEPAVQASNSFVLVPNVGGLSPRAAAARMHELGLRVEWKGTGAVTHQSPAPGSEVERGQTVVMK